MADKAQSPPLLPLCHGKPGQKTMRPLFRSLRNPLYALLIAFVIIALLQSLLSFSPLPPPRILPSSQTPHPSNLRIYQPQPDTPNILTTDDPAPLESAHSRLTDADLARTSDPNPIPHLITASEQQWTSKLSSQSTSLAQARAEYTNRYSHAPPEGYDEWYMWTSKNNIGLPDEFDTLMRSILPLLQLGPTTARRRTESLLSNIDMMMEKEKDNIGYITIGGADGITVPSNAGPAAQAFAASLEPVKGLINAANWSPFRLPINEAANHPRVLVHHDTPGDPRFESLSGRPLISALASACGKKSGLQRRAFSIRYEYDVSELPAPHHTTAFSDGHPDDADFCAHPGLLADDSSLLQGKDGLRVVRQAVPLLNPWGRPSVFGDIPSAPSSSSSSSSSSSTSRLEEREEKEKEKEEVLSWENREPRLSTYGEFSTPPSASTIQHSGSHPFARLQALLSPQNPINLGQTSLSPEKAKSLSIASNPSRARLEIHSSSTPFRSTGGLQLRTTTFQHWYNDRLQPWVHYIPLTPGLAEIWGLVGHFIVRDAEMMEVEGLQVMGDGMTGGYEEGGRIAGQGREWAGDRGLALGGDKARTSWNWRVLLEVARVVGGTDGEAEGDDGRREDDGL